MSCHNPVLHMLATGQLPTETEFAYNTAEKLSPRTHLIRNTMKNFEVELPMDGSKNGDVTTLHVNGGGNRVQEAIAAGPSHEDEESKEEADLYFCVSFLYFYCFPLSESQHVRPVIIHFLL